ncbi:MAG: cytochrome C oxidase subunit IV family protein [Desulfotignum sp.]|nr:cytochrome C oxidase subunit IV family protein [Desulfotignum sp.]MCF8125847.1 cytochrome C oxidase subunit IV family protein [Desulfotignum sp.]
MEHQSCIFEYRTLGLVLAALLIMTAVTVGASYIDLGWVNIWIALMIASIKAGLVLVVFMHLKFEGRAVILSFLSTVFFLAVMIGFIFWDVGFR